MGEPSNGERPRRIVFKDADGKVSFFSTDQIELVWSDMAFVARGTRLEFDRLALLRGNKWVLYREPTPFDDAPTAVRFITDDEALDWLLVRGHEPPACLSAAQDERCIVKATDARNENLIHVLDEDDCQRRVVIDVSGAQQWGPRKDDCGNYDPIDFVPEWFYSDTLYRLASGRFVRIRERSHREVDVPFEPEAKRLTDEEAAEWLLFGGFEPPADIAHLADKHRFKDDLPVKSDHSNGAATLGANEPLEPSEQLKAGYRDPDNYWRNVWLYQQRKAGKTNATIINELSKRAREFASLETENALRSAIESIANYHHWPVVRGKTGRPKATNAPSENPAVDFK